MSHKRLFEVKKDGSYYEIPLKVQNLQKDLCAFLVVDAKNKIIYIYRKPGISNTLSYSAGRAATNINTRRGNKYQIINIEPDETNEFFEKIFPQQIKSVLIETESTETEKREIITGEIVRKKIVPKDTITSLRIEKDKQIIKSKLDNKNLIKSLALKMFLDQSIVELKGEINIPRDELKKILINEINALLDLLY